MKYGRTKYVFYNISMNFMNQFTNILLSFISRTIFIKVLGVDLLGVNGLFVDLLSLLSMADLGINTAMVYSFYKPIAENDKIKISELVTFYKKIYNFIAITITILGISIIPFLKIIINTDKNIPLLNIYYLFSLAGVVLSYLFVYKTSIITADQKNYVITRITMIINFIKTTLQIFSLIIFKNYIIYLLINLVCNFINNFICSKKAEKLYPYINKRNELNKEEKMGIFNSIKSVFIYKISSILLTATDNTLISMIIGTTTVGYYSNYLLISNKVISIIQIIFGGLTASIGNVIVKDSSEKKYEIYEATQSVSFVLCGIIVTSFTLLVNDLISIWLGNEYLFNYMTVLAISLNMYLACVLQPLWSYREATGLYTKTKYLMLIAAILNLIISIILGKHIGIEGILFASSISRLLTYVWYEPYLLFKDYFYKPVKKFYMKIFGNFSVVFILTIILNRMLRKFVINSWSMLIIKSITIGGATSIIFFVIYSRSKGFKIILNKLGIFKEEKELVL